ncbi:MAG: DUF1302 domain-containing protein [Pseudomonas sp.]|nr:DUF1302 domain-containing protein [Pseudomonas sp.]
MEVEFCKTRRRAASAKVACGFATVLPLLLAQAQAVEFSFADKQVSGSIDSTLSFGQLWRVQGRDKSNDDINANDGNRNFDTGLVSEVLKITSDLEANYRHYGVFVRGTAFYDSQIMDKRNDYLSANDPRQPSQNFPNDDRFTSATRHKAGRGAQILDAYVYGNWDVADMPLTARVGRQVFNWGEGLFYRGAINTTNPVDAAKFRLPGAEVREVLVPVAALSFNIGLSDNLSMETFYQWNWQETAIDPVGTYFSETDLFAEGGKTAYTRSDNFAIPQIATPTLGLYDQLVGGGLLQGQGFYDRSRGVIKVANIQSDLNARDDGQFGVALRYIAEQLNSTEFGFFLVNYHAKEPTIYADLNADYAGVNADALCAAIGGASCADLTLAASMDNAGAAQALAGAAGVAAIDVANQVNGRREYAEDIRMYGMSFNTTLGEASVFGELAYRPNLPIGIAASNDLLGDLLSQALPLANGDVVNVGGQLVTRNQQIHSYERVEAFNGSLGSIYSFGPRLGFDALLGVVELASEHIRGSDLQYRSRNGTRYYVGRGDGSYISGYERDDQINKNAYGYTLLLSGTWNDVYAGINLSPFAVFKHDFEGNAHQTGNFIEGRKAHTLGLRASYLNSLQAELQYTEFYGAGQNNAGRDRDSVGANVKYSF